MKALLSQLQSSRNAAISAIAGVLACAFLPPQAFKDVTQEMMALFGLMMAGVLPTMVLTASALRAGNLSVKKLTEYHSALRRQMLVWFGLFLISLCASTFVIIGKMVDWSLPLSTPSLPFVSLPALSFDSIRFINAGIAASASLIVLRAFSVGRGILSLLRLSAEIAVGEAKLRDEERHRVGDSDVAHIAERPDYGKYVDLKH
ncbi:hypothetical protein CN186_30150 [Sinorhizobium medicae]|uniref:hypothetical protein n=1 Tax=Sinorhizobium medicae TaxID=110321 RepID=UPI000FD77DEA|nr:hypothetical protein [Sinorhizobium medicae]RVI87764.1 hypothetical protein CN186_30150 [Sinorhizobium medicae]